MIRRTRIVVAAAAALSAVAASGEPIDDAFAPFEGAKDIPGAVSAEMYAPSEPYFSCVGYADIAEAMAGPRPCAGPGTRPPGADAAG